MWLTPELLAGFATALGGAVGAATRSSWTARRRARQAAVRQDALEEWGWGVRHDARRHNAALPDNAEPFVVRPWPEWMDDA